jgi:glycosyltransferase involved in cell wall biosynthesis
VGSNNPRKPIKVLLLLHELSLTGAPISVLNMLESLRAETDIRTLAPYTGPLLDRCKNLGPLTLTSPMLHADNTLQRVRRKQRVRALERSLAEWRPDVIYINSVSSLRNVGSIKLPQAPILLHVHELESATRYLLHGDTKLLTDLPARYIAVSGPVKRMLEEDYGIAADRIACIPEAIPDSFIVPKSDANTASDGRIVIGGAGAANVRKGVLLWLQMAADLVRRLGSHAIRFQWVGDFESHEGQFYPDIAAKLGIGHCVEFTGVTKDPAAYFRNFDVFALTSWEDPCPLVVLETMGLGVPVVCFANSGGAPEQVGCSGIVVSDFSPAGMAEAIAALIADPNRRNVLGLAATQRFKENYTASVVGPRLLTELMRMVGN